MAQGQKQFIYLQYWTKNVKYLNQFLLLPQILMSLQLSKTLFFCISEISFFFFFFFFLEIQDFFATNKETLTIIIKVNTYFLYVFKPLKFH